METLFILYIFYMLSTILLIVISFFWLIINNFNKTSNKKDVSYLITGIFMFLIGIESFIAMVYGSEM
ncbi:hypothetical protein CLV55_1148 [Flavobacterium aciduliphilum]|uniref:Uncharacterized protein n=1 Tax=Flavobacterium aciduliphilum TaxID=1101402 RepID=A0A328YBS2_9FLAO|nr:hypothetical protein CLV55_1148 [Flavobacterium aciduliphilum]